MTSRTHILRVGFSYALEALSDGIASYSNDAQTVRSGGKIPEKDRAVRDRFAAFTQECRLNYDEIDSLRDKIFIRE